MAAVTDLVAFLEARIAEDVERANRCAAAYPTPWALIDRGWTAYINADTPAYHRIAELHQEAGVKVEWLSDALSHIASWDPARVLAECAAKRAWLTRVEQLAAGEYTYEDSVFLQWMAFPYADHPDYDPGWAP